MPKEVVGRSPDFRDPDDSWFEETTAVEEARVKARAPTFARRGKDGSVICNPT